MIEKLTTKDIILAIHRGDFTVGEVVQAAALAQGKDVVEIDRHERILELAHEQLPLSDGELELDDDNCIISEGDDNGTYVSVWAWLDFSGTDLDKEPEDEEEE